VQQISPARAHGRIRAPPSKSYTHRALVAAFLARRPSVVVDPLDSEDTRATRDGLISLGARVTGTQTEWSVDAGRVHLVRPRVVRCGESGTTLRFLTAVASLGPESVRFEGSTRLAVRPMRELHEALHELGASVRRESKGHALPCTVQGPIHAGRVAVGGSVSSQFTSAMLMVLPTLPESSVLSVRGRAVSRPYVDATCAVLASRGIRVRRIRGGFRIPGGQKYRPGRIRVPGDASSAAYLWAAGAVTGGSVEVEGIPADLPQADLAILSILASMGARVDRRARWIRVTGPITTPVTVDLTDSPDLFPLVSVLAATVAGARSRLHGAPHLEFKESDRKAQSTALARAFGAKVSIRSSAVEIVGARSLCPLNLRSLDDHRLVMSAAVGALATGGASRVGRAEAVSKSFPGFWEALKTLTTGGDPVA
jgi:3-phosphoshikimate 1-carboxyvinyltransferase